VASLSFVCFVASGDLAYAHGHSHVWDNFFNQIQPMAAAVPYMISVGNYEYDYEGTSGSQNDPSGVKKPFRPPWWNGENDSGGECGLPCALRFQMPGQQGNGVLHGSYSNSSSSDEDSSQAVGNPPFWYHFRYASAHFIVLSSEHDVSKGSQQHDWLESLLASKLVDRAVTPWLIVGIHRPLYVPYPHHSNRVVARHLRQGIEPLFSKHKVDVVISGHIHSYSRSCPVYNWDCVGSNSLNSTWHEAGPAEEIVSVNASTCVLEEDEEYDEYVSACSAGIDATDASERFVDNSSDSLAKDLHGATYFVIGTAGHKLSRLSQHQPDWVQFHDVTPGYGRFHVEGSQKMRMEFVDARHGKIVDSVEILKK